MEITASCVHVRHFVVIQMMPSQHKFILDIVFRHLHRQEALLFFLVTLGRVNISKPKISAKLYTTYGRWQMFFELKMSWHQKSYLWPIFFCSTWISVLLFSISPRTKQSRRLTFFFSSKRPLSLLPCAQWFISFSECYAALSPFWLWPRASIQQSVVCPAAQPQRPSLYLPDRDPIPALDPQSPPFIFN